MTYMVNADGDGETLAHPAGEHKAAFQNKHFFGRDALRDIIDALGLHETETIIDGDRVKVFHNENVAFSTTKDPWQDYPLDSAGSTVKRAVYREEWGGRVNPLKPGRAGFIRIVGDQSSVLRLYNLINWNSHNHSESLNNWNA